MNVPAPIAKNEIAALDATVQKALQTLDIGSAFERTFALAEAIDTLRNAITPAMMERFMKLQNTRLGFKTDKDPNVWNKRENAYNKPYGESVVKDCVIEAVLRGVQTVGNQFNIISGGCYLTKEGFEYKLKTLKGLSQLKVNLGVPKVAAGGALVECDASWVLNGKEDSMKATIACKGDDYAGADSYIGKASRKFLKRIYERCTGTTDPDGEVDGDAARVSDAPRQVTGGEAPQFGPVASETGKPGAQTTPEVAKPGATGALESAAEPQSETAPLTPPAQKGKGAGPVTVDVESEKSAAADPAEPVPGKVTQLRPDLLNSPNAKLESFLTNAGVSFDQFRKWAADTERLEDADSFAAWLQLPGAFCSNLLRDTKSLNKCVTRCKS